MGKIVAYHRTIRYLDSPEQIDKHLSMLANADGIINKDLVMDSCPKNHHNQLNLLRLLTCVREGTNWQGERRSSISKLYIISYRRLYAGGVKGLIETLYTLMAHGVEIILPPGTSYISFESVKTLKFFIMDEKVESTKITVALRKLTGKLVGRPNLIRKGVDMRKVMEMRDRGMGYRQIARHLGGVSASTLHAMVKSYQSVLIPDLPLDGVEGVSEVLDLGNGTPSTTADGVDLKAFLRD